MAQLQQLPRPRALEQTRLAFGPRYEPIAQPFEWKFSRQDLHRPLERLQQPTPALQLAA